MANACVSPVELEKRKAFSRWMEGLRSETGMSFTQIARDVGASPGDLQSRVRQNRGIPSYLPEIEKLVGRSFLEGVSLTGQGSEAVTEPDLMEMIRALRKAISDRLGIPETSFKFRFEF